MKIIVVVLPTWKFSRNLNCGGAGVTLDQGRS